MDRRSRRRRSSPRATTAGEKVSAVARRHGLTPQQLFGWRREAQRRAGRGREMTRARYGAAFAPVIVEEARPSPEAPIAPNRAGGAAIIEIVIGAATVRVALGH